MDQLAAYPRWLVASCGVVVALAVLWVLSKVLKLTVQVVIALIAIAVITAAVWWVLGYL
jgi:hypothetical protein